MSKEVRLPCQGQPIENVEFAPWCLDCPYRSVAPALVEAEAAEQPVMISTPGIEREIEAAKCESPEVEELPSDCGSAYGKVCKNGVLSRLADKHLKSINTEEQPVQSDVHLLE